MARSLTTVKCVCGRTIKSLGRASHRAACKVTAPPSSAEKLQWPFPKKVAASVGADLRADQPHPWRVESGKRYGGCRPFWTISRYNPGKGFMFNTETVLTRAGARRWYSEERAQAECDRMNAASGVEGRKP